MSLDHDAILKIFRQSGAFLEGHFLLTSGLHTPYYLQCAKIFEDPELANQVVNELVLRLPPASPNYVTGPALGGILLAYEVARKLGAKAAFTERINGKMELRRGFSLPPGGKALIAEDVLTTGGSVLEVAQALQELKVTVTGVVALVNRGEVELPYPTTTLLSLKLPTMKPEACNLCQTGKPITKPGSRAV